MAIRITALGPLRVEQEGRVLERLPAQRMRLGILLYLGVEREATREQLMGMFWGDRPPERARHLLSQTLYELRQDLGDRWMTATGEGVSATPELVVDAVELADAVAAGRYEDALSLYGGGFLSGATLPLGRPFEGWVDAQQARIGRLHRQARRGAIDQLAEAGALEAALARAREWVELDPLDDEAQHRLIELMAATGDRSGALRQYDRYAALVAKELELEPLDDTRALVERIREGEVGERRGVRVEAPVAADHPVELEGTAGATPAGTAAVGGAGADARAAPDGPAGRPRRKRVAAVGVVAVTLFAALFGVWLVTELRQPGTASEAELDPRRVAVLFFDDHSPEQDLAPIAAGFTEALIHELDQAEGLEILSRSAVEPYRHQKPTLDSIIRDLRAGTLVEGSLTRVGDSLRVTFQLIDGATRTHHLSGTLHRPASEVHTIVRDLPQLVALQLRRRLGTEIRLRERRTAGSAEAWTLVQRARLLREDQSVVHYEDLDAAVSMLERADSLLAEAERADPGWIEPPLERARVTGRIAGLRSATPSRYDPAIARRALEHVERALRIDPDDPAARAERGLLLYELGEAVSADDPAHTEQLYAGAESDLRLAVELDPQQARAWWTLSRVLRRKGSLAEGKQAAHRALAADAFLQVPVGGLFQLFQMALETEEHQEAAEWCALLHERYPDNMRWAQCELVLLGTSPPVPPDVDRSWALVDSVVARGSEENAPIYEAWSRLFVAKALARAGYADSARAVLQRTIPDDPPPKWAVYDLAHAHLMLGDVDRSLELLEIRARENPGPSGSLATDWWFRPLHGDPRLERLIRRATEAGGGGQQGG